MTFQKTKHILNKWLLTVTFVLGIFSFSGYVVNSQPRQQQSIQTEVLFSFAARTGKEVRLFYTRILQPINVVFFSTKDQEENIRLIVHKSIRIKLISLGRKFCSIKSESLFYQAKTIPLSSDEEHSFFMIG